MPKRHQKQQQWTPGRLKQIKSILKSNRDRLPEQLDLQVELPQDHKNIRGPHNFH